MAFWTRKGVSEVVPSQEIAEIAPLHPSAIAVASPRGFPDGIPFGGTTAQNPGGMDSVSRKDLLVEMYGAYMSCSVASACVDVIARTITAAGLVVIPDAEDDNEKPPTPPEVKRLQSLFDFVNPRENIRQLMRGVVTDLLVYGDAFLEVVWLGDQPAALYSLDSPSMIPLSDEHGNVYHYTQQLDPQRTAEFEPNEVIHIALDSPRGGLYGVGAIQKALLPIKVWLFAGGLLKETIRKGDPPRVHFDYPLEVPENVITTDRAKWLVQTLGIPNTGNPFITRGGAVVADLKPNAIAEYLGTITQKRDEIISSMGVPPRKLGIAEPGQLGGTGEGAVSDKTFRVNTCGPIAELVLEKINYELAFCGFGVTDWRVKFDELDWRDDQVIETIRDQRLRNGTWTLNRYKREIGEPEVDGGDQSVLVERQIVIDWDDIPGYSKALVGSLASKGAPSATESELMEPSVVERVVVARPPRSVDDEEAALTEAWNREYQQRRKQALKELPKVPV